MKKVIHKLFWVWDFDKEEKWLNEMAAKGLCLTSAGFWTYEFEDCTPASYTIRLELLDKWPNHPESQKYIQFVEETGAEQISSVLRWVYFRKKTEDGVFDIFSDFDSRIQHLNRILTLIGILSGFNLYIGISYLYEFFVEGQMAMGISFLNLFAGLLGLYGFYRLFVKRENLKRERQIFE
ncbi:MAG: DUF2812 domain-containing protein [Tissierellia bacterium]|nr:DUF2812 domain-containing protein [Tissierellia bacterium]